MSLNAPSLSNTSVDFRSCSHHFIWDGVCECLEKKGCKFAYSYGGDNFCKHPVALLKGKRNAQGEAG